ncbi:spore germination protein [Bacillus sp. SD075]|uniref:spore germination protein n=1 Tax=Bacillus sp. SD075 TaxID=2781732 RepID=UPI002867FAC4|nr:spore germination protein [Bacillus sp. SD075]
MIGQASAQAGLVSTPMVIMVTITGIASFMMPRYIAGIAIRMLRFPMLLLAGTIGLLGIMMGLIAMVTHFMQPAVFRRSILSTRWHHLKGRELKDMLWSAPGWRMDICPRLTGESTVYSQPQEQGPNPKKGSDTE